jgi:hypothetical protein
MEIRVTDIGQLDGKAWLCIEEGVVKINSQVDATQLYRLAHSIIFVLSESAKSKAKFAEGLSEYMNKLPKDGITND